VLKVVNYYFGKDGLEPVPEEAIMAFFADNYARCKHILISATDESGAELKGEDMNKVRSEAQAVFEKAKNADEATFDKLIEKYNDDEGVSAYPDGYVFTTGEMVDEFEKAAFDMEVGETRLVQTDYGFHIMRKLTLEDEKIFTQEIRQKMLMSLKSKEIGKLFDQWREELPCKVNTGVLRKYTCKSVKMGEETSQSEEEQLQALAEQLKQQAEE
jgi:parvulin-like peptidyl-prolyl isomerase